MATSEHDIPDPEHRMDLDRLIGELETEAARRRADPAYPHDADARLHFELARMAPHPPRAEALHEIVAQVDEVVAVDAASTADVAPTGRRGHDREATSRHLQRLDGRVAALGLAVAGAFHAVAARLEQLEERVRLLEPYATEGATSPLADDTVDVTAPWRAGLADAVPPGRRVLYAQSHADEVVAELRAAGVDAYGVTTTGPRHQPGPDVRWAELLTHLRAVDDDALGAVVLAGDTVMLAPRTIAPVVAELGRVTETIVVISEAPWWWRLRLGAVNADLAPARPLDPDTWLHAFHAVALAGTAQYDPDGRSYRVVVRART